ncbi:hypothetical protein [Umezawaea sp. NPDC059074]|uniref:hypothetical protein n=1 Tax=Umezawaea sp. NPDC059074 TaxID=3346716 RepID=UPI0036C88876
MAKKTPEGPAPAPLFRRGCTLLPRRGCMMAPSEVRLERQGHSVTAISPPAAGARVFDLAFLTLRDLGSIESPILDEAVSRICAEVRKGKISDLVQEQRV